METLNFSQQAGIFDPQYAKHVTVIGVGSVGSHVVYMLANMGVKDITVYDDDGVESHNIPMSAYRPNHIGLVKVFALQNMVREDSGVTINVINKMYTGEELTGAVVMCVDNMEARAFIWEKVKENPNVDIFIDTRTAKEFISIFALNPCDPEDMDYYKNFSYPSSEAVKPNCGEHGLFSINAHAASVVCGNLINWWKNGRKKQHHEELCLELSQV